MSNIKNDLSILKELIEPLLIGAMPAKKRYANSVMDRIISEINKRELDVLNLEAKINGFTSPNDYLHTMQKYIDIMLLMGCSDIPIKTFRTDFLRWICEHNESQKKPMTFEQVCRMHRMILVFENDYLRLPESTTELINYFND